MKHLRIIMMTLAIGAVSLATFGVQATPAAAMGSPAFNIDSWDIVEGSLSMGSEFTLSLTFSNVGTYGANEVLVDVGDNENFFGLGSSPRFQEMGIGAQVTTTIEVGISPTIETGYHDLPVEFSYHHAALGGAVQTDTRTIGLYVTGLSPYRNEPDTGSPMLVIESSDVALSGDEDGVLLTSLTLHNSGNRVATSVVVSLADTSLFIPAGGASTAFALGEDIGVGDSATLTIPLILVNSPDGQTEQAFNIEYASYTGGSYSDTQSVPLLLGDVTAQMPHLYLQGYTTDPETVSPGGEVRLTLDIANLGAGAAQEVFIRLGEEADTLGGLAPVGSSNVLYVDEIPGESEIQIGYDLAAAGDAESGLVATDVELTYSSAYGIQWTDTFTVSLRIEATPNLTIGLYGDVPETITVGDTFELPVQVINIGQNSVNVSTIEVTSDLLGITNGSLYLGQLDGGTSGSLAAQAEALEAGTATVAITVNYLDDFQQPQAITERMTFEVQEAGSSFSGSEGAAGAGPGAFMEAEQMTLGQRILNGILGFLGLGTRSTAMGGFSGSVGQGQ
jgi:hypothetical protein